MTVRQGANFGVLITGTKNSRGGYDMKNDLFFSARMFKGMCNDNIELFFELNRDLNLSEEAIAYCGEIWPKA
jgi:hypothetical protein